MNCFCGGLCYLLFLSNALAFAEAPNLCRAPEDPLFSCPLTNGKFVSACAPSDEKLNRYISVIYRFGTPGHIELSLPADPKEFRRVAFVDETTGSSKQPIEDDTYLRFASGRFDYLLYAASADAFDRKGLAVFRNGRLVSKVGCEPESYRFNTTFNDLLNMGVQSELDNKKPFRYWSQLLPKNSVVLKNFRAGKSYNR